MVLVLCGRVVVVLAVVEVVDSGSVVVVVVDAPGLVVELDAGVVLDVVGVVATVAGRLVVRHCGGE